MGMSCLAKVPAITIRKAIVNVVLALFNAKSTIDVMNYLLKPFDYFQQNLGLE